ncbi:hypothetical protein AWC38_SpisGene7062 [Stylophora pistillata]|uniref:Uncharacterized protein n=1 Tax=Stylophora pistillata TaxID=50429 RepID=A0A2B4SC55_STYPI|nr:hypothetical protein AWC38_SpisGene7062 [Stylophora pistillata]
MQHLGTFPPKIGDMIRSSTCNGVSSIESLCVWRRSAYLAASGKAGGLYDCDLANSNVKQLLQNSSDSCSEIKRLCHYGDVIVFIDIVDRKVKTFDPRTTTVEILMGTGKEGANDGTGETCTFAQVHGICCLQNTIFVSDVAAGMVLIVSPLTGTVSFLQTLGKLYDSFGISAQTVDVHGTRRSETTKDKVRALAPAVYYAQPPHPKVMLHDDSTVEGQEGMEQIMPQVIDDDGDSHVPSITFVNDSTVEIVAVGEVPDQEDEYDTDSGSDMDDDDHHTVISSVGN